MKTLIVNARVITPLETIAGGSVLVNGSFIESVSAAKPAVPPGCLVINAGGNILCPGFIDLHIQGGGGSDVIEATPEAVGQVARVHLKHGTTSFLATTIAAAREGKDSHLRALSELSRQVPGGGNVLGIHLEGPFISQVKKGMIRGDYISRPGMKELAKIIKACGGKLRMMTVAPEVKGNIAVIKELRSSGIIASLGHTDAGYEDAMAGIKAGITHATHFFNAMTGLHHRFPGAVGACFDSDVSVQLIADLVHVHPAVVKLTVRSKGPEKTALITDAVMAAEMPDGAYEGYGQKIFVKRGIVRGAGGVLAGSTLTQDRAVRNIVSLGFPAADAIRMATLTPAQVIGISGRKGIIKKGADADLIIIDNKINVRMVMVRGKVEWKSQAQSSKPKAQS